MGTSGKTQGGFKFMTLGSTKKVVIRSWDSIPIPDTVIARVNALVQGKSNDIDLLDTKKRPIGEFNITGADDGEIEAPHIELIEPYTDLDPILAREETLPELVEHQETPTIELEQDMGV